LAEFFPKISNYFFEKFGHRGLFHSIWPLIILGLAFLANKDLLTIFIAYLSHLFLDSLTPFGVMLFYPLNLRIVFFSLAKTGSLKEMIFIILLIGISCAYAYIMR